MSDDDDVLEMMDIDLQSAWQEIARLKAELEAARTPGPDVSQMVAAARELLELSDEVSEPSEKFWHARSKLRDAIDEHETAAKGGGGHAAQAEA